jgi:TIR domain
MKVFISWSGVRSRAIALGLREWLPDIIQDVEPFMSENDIGAGVRWGTDLTKKLEDTDIGILCLTPENLTSPWLLFEAGSLAKKLEASRVIPYRLDLKATEVAYPLAQFQSVDASREGTLMLLKTLNSSREHPMEVERLERVFSRLWDDLEKTLTAALALPADRPPERNEREILEEILQLARNQQTVFVLDALTKFQDLGFEHIGENVSPPFGIEAEVYWHEEGFTRDEALELCGVLKHRQIPCRLGEHKDKRVPDAIFIGALVPAEAARIALRAIPYKIEYIFSPDYPEEMGGSESGLKIGIGYRSTHAQDTLMANAAPFPLSDNDLARLTEPGISNIEFQRHLRRITAAR